MLNLIYAGLARLLPQSGPTQVPHPWINEDSGWHSSSYELARGLEVIEHLNPPTAVFADTLPAFQPARA
jgi:hypothetical protein